MDSSDVASNGDVTSDSPSSVPASAMTEKATVKDSAKLPLATTEIKFKKEGFQIKPSHGLIGCLFNIAKYFFVGIFNFFVRKSGLNRILRPFGLSLEPIIWRGEKRKYSEVEDEDADDNTTDKDDDKEEEKLELEMKRWRPDKVYEAINDFVKRMWGEKDANDNMKDSINDDIASGENVKWNKKPDINFVARKAVGVKSVAEGEAGYIRDLTPKKANLDGSGSLMTGENVLIVNDCRDSSGDDANDSGDRVIRNKFLLNNQVEETIETSTPLVESKAPEVFVFSADKSTNSAKSTEDLKEDEQSMLSLMTFGEKQIYFAQKIKDEEAAAMKSTPRRSPLPTM